MLLSLGLALLLGCRTQAQDVFQGRNATLKTSMFIQTSHNGSTAQHGTDITLSCEVSRLPGFSTLQWEREGAPIANTSLLLNNTAYIILHSVDERSQGKYTCKLRHSGKVELHNSRTLNVSKYTYSSRATLYRETSNSSDLSLICKSNKSYDRILWQLKQSNVVMIAAQKGRERTVNGTIEPGRRSSTMYNGNDFIFHISPVKFGYNGTYTCLAGNKTTYTSRTLCTVRVSADPPDGPVRNPSVVLTCEVSNVMHQVTLVWLRMEGIRAVLVKQGVLEKTNSRRTLSVTVDSLTENRVLWQCAVFVEGTLKALAPLWLEPQPAGDGAAEGSSWHAVIAVACAAVAACVAVLLGALLFYCKRKSAADDSHVATVKPEEEEEELHYASVTVVGFCHEAGGKAKRKVPDTSDSVVYSTVSIK